jgi:hypothetical protein
MEKPGDEYMYTVVTSAVRVFFYGVSVGRDTVFPSFNVGKKWMCLVAVYCSQGELDHV